MVKGRLLCLLSSTLMNLESSNLLFQRTSRPCVQRLLPHTRPTRPQVSTVLLRPSRSQSFRRVNLVTTMTLLLTMTFDLTRRRQSRFFITTLRRLFLSFILLFLVLGRMRKSQHQRDRGGEPSRITSETVSPLLHQTSQGLNVGVIEHSSHLFDQNLTLWE